MAKKTYFTTSGTGYTQSDINSIIDYQERTGHYPENFSEEDIEEFHKKFVIPYRQLLEDDIDPAGGRGIHSHI